MKQANIQSLVWEDSTRHRTIKPVCHNYWTCVLQLLKPTSLEPVLHNKRCICNEKSMHCHQRVVLLSTTRESPHSTTKTQSSQPQTNK